ncbi:hypothetical protein IMZ31_24010 (plasmid) [Pontibacillus sp. ALD_SL1]|uniref:hypothetical protein n=1 Tax=Pontibacillus sp. ALD_SL1 TaxID=2777185 RepID=UPI001A970BC9|nr:hypothetical protein [Pontibacillus sp. ALD_SL1]QST02518.1 hypothetical protein IMZ31_24010 [Pontibacillus sp. ALD_SL1]
MKELTMEELKPLDLAPLFLKHVEVGNIGMYRYENVHDLREISRLCQNYHGWTFKSPHEKVIGIRMTDEPLNEDVMREPREQNETHTLTQDNRGCNGRKYDKRTVTIRDSDLVRELKHFFRWRKDVGYDRLMKQGSYNYDRFIKHLYESGYRARLPKP